MDQMFMKRALKLAEKGIGFVAPNPLVGAVIVKDGRIIGEGYHQQFGEAHAEVNAIKNATEAVEGATMYVTLEPCSHYGKTPPCSQLIIKHRLARVVIASLDPNPVVAGSGIERLKEANIEVDTGILDEENKILNKVFFKYIEHRTPFVLLKTAMTLDGKIATVDNHSKWISNDASRAFVHELRHQMQAIMVGINTVKYDNPMLTARRDEKESKHPTRIIIDSKLSISTQSNLVKTAKDIPTIIMTTKQASYKKIEAIRALNVKVFIVDTHHKRVDLKQAFDILGAYGISSILLEGGSTLAYSALEAGIVDEVYSFIAPKIFGGQDAPTPVGGKGIKHVDDAFKLALFDVRRFGDDVCLMYTCKKEEQ